MEVYLLLRLLLPLTLPIVPHLLVLLHPVKEVEFDIGHVLRPQVSIVFGAHVRVSVLEYYLTEMLRVPLDQLVIVHQINDVVGGEAASSLHLRHFLVEVILLLSILRFPLPLLDLFYDLLSYFRIEVLVFKLLHVFLRHVLHEVILLLRVLLFLYRLDVVFVVHFHYDLLELFLNGANDVLILGVCAVEQIEVGPGGVVLQRFVN